MSAEDRTPTLDALDDALARGDIEGVRRALVEADGEEQAILEDELGRPTLERARRAAARSPRGGKLGKVLLLPGIMGSELDVVDLSGDADRVWINILRLMAGRIADLELTLSGGPKKPGIHVRTAGVHRKTYVPMLVELDERWEVKPFPFDWREDIEHSADRLQGELEAFGAGDPVHLVAHSMGGLVSRLLIARHPETWAAIDDPDGRRRGGRLVMLGTPNRGSFSIPLALTGKEKLLKILDLGDLDHNMGALLRIISTFPGMVQMLPSPEVVIEGSDHQRLYEGGEWAAGRVAAQLLASAQALHRQLDDVVDAHRLVYVAGYDRPTPFRTRIEGRGQVAVGQTRDGDSRVPHILGLLEGVATFWVDETHDNLARNRLVLDAITDLLSAGTTAVLASQKPAPSVRRAAAEKEPTVRQSDQAVPAEARVLVEKSRRPQRRGDGPPLTPREQARLEDLAFEGYLGTRADVDGREGEPPPADRPPAVRAVKPFEITVEVAWGDVTRIAADVHCVGHYEGVLPQNAELALDRVVSGIPPSALLVGDGEQVDSRADPPRVPRARLVITRHTRRGLLTGALGEVTFFPWAGTGNAARVVAVGGMGPPGSFDVTSLARLTRALVVSIWALPAARRICTVLIGSGEGSLTTRESVRGLLRGLGDAAAEIAADASLSGVAAVETLVIAERERSRAFEIHEALRTELAGGQPDPRVKLTLGRSVRTRAGGAVSRPESFALLVEAARGVSSASTAGKAVAALLGEIDAPATVRDKALVELRQPISRDPADRPSFDVPHYRVERRVEREQSKPIPVRLSFVADGGAIRAAAIHEAATVPERIVTVDRQLVDELVERTTDPQVERIDGVTLSELICDLLVPPEFRRVLGRGPSYVFDVDRAMAQVHWEMLAVSGELDPMPVSVQFPVARQLRTTYSPAPLTPARPDGTLKALVVGDPGDPARGESLPGARSEALRVVELLRERQVDVTARIGAPSVPREGKLAEIGPANRLDVLALLLGGDFDLVHYAGHGDFDEQRPDRVGWVFADGLITPAELGQVERVPAVVVANACLTARTSQRIVTAKREGKDEPRSEAGLLPSLADEFFHLGVRNYVGTAWEVNDLGATLFAENLYSTLLPAGGRSSSFGDAVRAARKALWDNRGIFGPLWAAYQHYGDPTSEARLAVAVGGD